jgi:hypothetical protein
MATVCHAVLSTPQAGCATARNRINRVNLHDNILLRRQRADLILKKGESHLLEEVAPRRL